MLDTETMPMIHTTSLAERIGEGHLSVSDALRYASQMGDALRRIHDAGQAHGALTPMMVLLGDHGVEIVPPREGQAGAVTGYTAPELLLGLPADARSDVFSFGAILFEMLTGRRAFEGETRATVAANLSGATAPSTGSPAADRVVAPCLAKNPEARTPRMQKVLMELKLLSVAARRAEAAAAPPKSDPKAEAAAMRSEMEHIEARLVAKLTAQEQMMQEVQHAAAEAVSALKEQLSGVGAELAAAQERIAAADLNGPAGERLLARVDRGFEAVGEHIGRLEQTLEEVRKHSAQFDRSVSADLMDIEQKLKAQSTALESARVSIAQTDDLVERVVEALESLQTAILDQAETPGRNLAVN